jgi:hypothetical protein
MLDSSFLPGCLKREERSIDGDLFPGLIEQQDTAWYPSRETFYTFICMFEGGISVGLPSDLKRD